MDKVFLPVVHHTRRSLSCYLVCSRVKIGQTLFETEQLLDVVLLRIALFVSDPWIMHICSLLSAVIGVPWWLRKELVHIFNWSIYFIQIDLTRWN